MHFGLQVAIEKTFAGKRSVESGRQVTGPDFSAGQRAKDMSCQHPGLKLSICWCTEAIPWPLSQVNCKSVEVGMQVAGKMSSSYADGYYGSEGQQ
jgi:hypothetical protein